MGPIWWKHKGLLKNKPKKDPKSNCMLLNLNTFLNTSSFYFPHLRDTWYLKNYPSDLHEIGTVGLSELPDYWVPIWYQSKKQGCQKITKISVFDCCQNATFMGSYWNTKIEYRVDRFLMFYVILIFSIFCNYPIYMTNMLLERS